MQELYDAVLLDNPDAFVEFLHRARATGDRRSYEGALREAVRYGRFRLVAEHMTRDLGVELSDEFGETPLMWAARFGQQDILVLFLERGANVNAVDKNGWTALMHACIEQRTSAMNVLLQAGADLQVRDGEGRTAEDLARLKVVSCRLPLLGDVFGWRRRWVRRSPALKLLIAAKGTRP